jgi:hypothetical protein
MMQHTTRDICGAFTAAPGVAITPLPFGGAVLVNGRTLALLECAEPDAALLAALVGGPANRHERAGAMATPLEAAATRLVRDGWLVPTAKDGEAR